MERFGIRFKKQACARSIRQLHTLSGQTSRGWGISQLLWKLFLHQFLGQIVMLYASKNAEQKSQPNRSKTDAMRDLCLYPGLWPSQLVLNKKHSIDIDLFVELGRNFGYEGAQHTLGSWFDSKEKLKLNSTNNPDNPSTSIYQPGSTGIIIRGPMTQYAKHGNQHLRKLDEHCSYVFWLNPLHKFRVH